jgi:hypothetical protein
LLDKDLFQRYSEGVFYFFALFKKELHTLAIQPIVPVTALIFSASCILRFYIATGFFIAGQGSADLRLFFVFIPYISILAVPVLTMSLWRGEQARCDQGLPGSDGFLVVAKWLAAWGAFLVFLIPGVTVPIRVSFFGDLDLGQIAASYLGIGCFGALAIALGEFFAIATANPAAAFLLTALSLGISNSIHLLPLYTALPRAGPLALGGFLNQLSFAWHFDAASKGIIDSRDFVFYAAMTWLCLYGSEIVLDRRRLRG